MPHLNPIRISKNVELACYAHRHLDSSLAVFVQGDFWLLNINDTELNGTDINIITKKFGNPSVLYNQFSIAGSDGIEAHLVSDAAAVLERMVKHHELLNAKLTIPFASFVKFARKDNQYMNQYVNTVFDAKAKFIKKDKRLIIQAIGGDFMEWDDVTGNAANEIEIDEQGRVYFSPLQKILNDEYDYPTIDHIELKNAVEYRVSEWRRVSSKFALKALKLENIRFRITDWHDEIWEVDFYNGTFSCVKTRNFDISIASQPLFQSFQLPFGVQTLGVFGRYKFAKKYKDVPGTWKKIRILSSLYKA